MKKIIVLFCLVIASYSLFAQRTVYHQQPEKLFNQGKEMFFERNYTGAQDLLMQYSSIGKDAFLLEEAAYMNAASAFYKGDKNSADMLKEFLDRYPETIHRNQVLFFIGSYHFDEKNWELAKFWLDQSNLDYLTSSEQEDHSFRTAYSNLQLGKLNEAYRLFGLLSQNSSEYNNAGNFYLGYIDYKNGEYDNAIQRFERLKSNPEYKEEVAFYSAQSTFFNGNLENAIQLADAFISTYPASDHITEMYRVLGNSHFRSGRPTRAIPYYENYLQKTDSPLRGDAYFIGLSYVEAGKLNEAIPMFQNAIKDRDALSQNAQLQLGQTYLKLGERQKAQMAFESASRDSFDVKARETAMFNYALLIHQTNFSVFSESITLFENFLKEFPNSQFTDQVNDILAETFLTTKDYNAALNAINRIERPGRQILETKQKVLFQLGAQEFINGNMNNAIQHFNNTIAMGDNDLTSLSNALYWRGESFYRIGNFDSAASDYSQFTQRASSRNENYALGWYNLGYAQFKQQQYTKAQQSFLKYLSTESNKNRAEYADALNRVGDTYYYNRNFANAEQYYAQASNANPETADYAAYQKAFVMGLQHNYQGKIVILNQMMSNFPNSTYYDDALYEKSRALTMINRETEAISTLQELISTFPKSPSAGKGGIQLGQLYYNAGNYSQSISAYKSVIENFPGSDDARTALVSMETVYRDMNDIQSYVNYANSLPGGMKISPSRQDSLTFIAAESMYMKNSPQEAETALLKYLQSFPNGAYSNDANYYMGLISDKKGNQQQAISYFRKVIDNNSEKYMEDVLTFTSQYAYAKGDFQLALRDYSMLANVSQSKEKQIEGLLGVVRTQYKLESYHESARAASDLISQINLSPEVKTEATYIRGKSFQQVNETDKAIVDYQELAKDTRSIYGAEAQYILSNIYYNWKSYDKAEAQVKDFMQKGTPHQYWMARALIVLSDTYKAKGDNFQARQYLESLKENYKGKEPDIQQLINERLNN